LPGPNGALNLPSKPEFGPNRPALKRRNQLLRQV
jgi:hypothetical protein